MNTLDEAWAWYTATRNQVRTLRRLARNHWDELPWDGRLGQDDRLGELDADEVAAESAVAEYPLDDLAILVLFSVFEAVVRDFVLEQIRKEVASLTHPTLQHAAEEVVLRVEEGSFFRVLEPYKPTGADLVEQVNQVRRYRNWVAHGKRGRPATQIAPREAFVRLRDFLTAIGLSAGGGAP